MKEKMGIILGAGVALLVIVGVVFFILKSESIELSDLVLIIIPIILVIAVGALLFDRFKNLKAGLPSADERAKKLHWKAGAYAYYATIWIAVGTMWYNIIFADNLGFPQLTVEQVVGAVVLLSGLVWFALQFYFSRQGDIE